MLQLLLGRSGSGKTHAIYQSIVDMATGKADNSGRIILLVPEQYSFETERALLHLLGPDKVGRVDVLSFSRLAERVFKEIGGSAGQPVTDSIRTLLMSRALEQVGDQLKLYRQHLTNTDYISSLLALVAEFKQYGITPKMLEETAARLPEDSTLRQKTGELALILEGYQALLEAGYIDPQDHLTKLAERIGESSLIRQATVFVDGFKGFTEQELAVLAQILRLAGKTTVALSCEKIGGYQNQEEDWTPFYTAEKTAGRLIRLAQDHRIPVATPIRLTENHRTQSPALKTIEEGCFVPDFPPYEGPSDAVKVIPCTDIFEECELAAHTIRRLLREEGLRCREVAVVARNLPDYDGILQVAFERAGVPVFMDTRQDILTDPLIVLVQKALSCVTGGFQTPDLLGLMKTGLLGFSPHSCALVENYVYMWRINGSRWRRDWADHPEGLTVKADEKTDRMLGYLNLLRRRLVAPLERLAQEITGGRVTGKGFAQALYRYLQQTKAPGLVRFQVARLDAAGEHSLADRMARMWDLLMSLLDTFGTVLAETALPAARLTELFSMMISTSDFGVIPQSLDAVQVGSADRIRFSGPKVVWILGANEGVFPAYPAGGSLLNDRDRELLAAQGLQLADTGDRQTLDERFLAYMALAAPSEKLYISYLLHNGKGETLSPSILPEMVRHLLPQADLALPETVAESEAQAFEQLAVHFGEKTPETAALRRLFAEKEEYTYRLSAMEKAAENRPAAMENTALAKALFGKNMRLSPSQTESYYQCRFAFFCRYGLRAKVRRPADLDALEFGTLVHYVMQEVLPGYVKQGCQQVSRQQAYTDAAATVARYVEECMGGTQNKSGRFLQQVQKLKKYCGNLLWYVVQELRQSRFVPVDYELEIGRPDEQGQGIAPLTVTLTDGTQVQMIGKIDRVDVYAHPESDIRYVRVVDYKTGSKEFNLAEVVEGINLQMLIYLFSIWQNGVARYGTVSPAGVLYLPAKLPVFSAERRADPETIRKEGLKSMKMNGLLLDHPEIIQAMEYDAAGLFIPAKLKKDGQPDAKASVASLAQFGKLKQRMEKLLSDMAETLCKGDIAAIPAKGSKLNACEYCDYAAVCGFEEGQPVRQIADNRKLKEVLEALDKEEL